MATWRPGGACSLEIRTRPTTGETIAQGFRRPRSVRRDALFFQSGLPQAVRFVRITQLIHEGIKLPIENARDVAEADVDAMIGDPVLGKVIGPNFLRPVATTDLGAACISTLLRQALLFHLIESGAQD